MELFHTLTATRASTQLIELGCFVEVVRFLCAADLVSLERTCVELHRQVSISARSLLVDCSLKNESLLARLHWEECLRVSLDPQSKRDIGCGLNHSVFLDRKHKFLGIGMGSFGKLGPDCSTAFTPRRILAKEQVIKQVNCGTHFTVMLNNKGDITVFGLCGERDIALNSSTTLYRWSPGKQPQGDAGRHIASCAFQISSTGETLCWVSATGKVYMANLTSTPLMAEMVKDFGVGELYGRAVQVATSGHHHAIVAETGELFTWGYGSQGQLGHGNFLSLHQPRCVQGIPPIRSCAVGEYHTAAVSIDGNVFCFGSDEFMQFNQGKSSSVHTPLSVQLNQRAISIGCGSRYTAIVLANGDLLIKGSLEGFSSRSNLISGNQIHQIGCGPNQLLVKRRDGAVLGLGSSIDGQSGQGDDGIRLIHSIKNSRNQSLLSRLQFLNYTSLVKLFKPSVIPFYRTYRYLWLCIACYLCPQASSSLLRER